MKRFERSGWHRYFT